MSWVEKLNLATGTILVLTGLINFAKDMHTWAFSWIIFGSMYLIMDSYKPIQYKDETKFQKNAVIIRKSFSVIGFISSLLLIIYTII